ncbi:MAG TPA: inositol-3-phosphate synthase [Solirubrobacterales bacterium]|nr:inositol-3-phosphate synthase [Solirubrobacterales bacterium]
MSQSSRPESADADRVGVWLVGARGSVAATTITGAAAVAAGIAPETGIVTAAPPFTDAPLPEVGDLVFGGHDLVETPLALRTARLVDSGVIPPGVPEAVRDQLAVVEDDIRPGITWNEARTDPRRAADRVGADLAAFRERHGLKQVVVINVSSTEPPFDSHPAHGDRDELLAALGRRLAILPPSSLYALAAIESGCAYIDFTPSTGARLPALEALAEASGVPVAGNDGKTGETFMKAVLAPGFAARALRVRSWAGTNLLGGGDGASLAEPSRQRSKVDSKGRALEQILGYPIEAPVRIDLVRDLGEWKTAWDHVTFEGFLGVRMRVQFTWEGCDSALAAPLVIDLARLGALALERGAGGVVGELGFFFKDPAGTDDHSFHRQYAVLCEWVSESVEESV